MYIAAAILALGVIILVHEAGHFLAARACGMRVETFSIGFGPSLVAWHGKQTEYRLAVVPLGGYVRIAGMTPGDGTPEDDPRSFLRRPAWQRFVVIFAGPLINCLFAFLLLTALYTAGIRVATNEPVIEEVVGAAAAAAGLLPLDRIVSIDDQKISTWVDVVRAVESRRGSPMQIRVARGMGELTLTATTGTDGKLGISQRTQIQRYPLREAMGRSVVKSVEIVGMTLDSLRQMLRPGGRKDVLMGPLGIVRETVEAVSKEFLNIFFIVVQISLVIGVMNLLPIPALDGGRLVFILLALVRRRPVDPKLESAVHGVGLLLLVGLILYATYGDVGRILHSSDAGRVEAPAPAAGAQDAGQ